MQLATVGDDGGARCRTLSLRERHGRALWFTTDQRSEKAMQLERQASAEAC
ncbi:MAG TPA: pyridoxamine 5'-phosphate oxidase, partial [Alcanivorax sp.]|nr:pyridoxamine 5'-phosphate oxidase [Alcanivorax sp.]